MKKFILLAAAAILLSACTSEDNYIDDPVAAKISASIGESPLSRASNVKWDEEDNIGISMGDSYLNVKYTTEKGDGIFDGAPMYFKNKVDPVNISAYYPFTGTEGELPLVIEASTGAERQTPAEQLKFDFLYAVKENVTGADPNVILSFSHKMSKLTFKFINGDGMDVSKIASLEIDGLIMEGTFNPASGVCAAKADTPSAVLSLTPAVVNDKELDPLILFPQTIADKVTMKITDSENQKYSCELNFTDNRLESGNNYQFTIKVKKTELSVNGNITDWKTDPEPYKSEAKSDD